MRPVLALVLPGATTEVLAQTGGGWLVNPHDAGRLEQVLEDIYKLWTYGDLCRHYASIEMLRRFDRKSLTGELARIFDATAKRCATPGRLGEEPKAESRGPK
jgi:hypothetical protein